jgi:hypothetical protein
MTPQGFLIKVPVGNILVMNLKLSQIVPKGSNPQN